MKETSKHIIVPLFAFAALAIVAIGCATGSPPSRIEQGLFNVQTNTVWITNTVPQVVRVTNEFNLVTTQTNFVTVTTPATSYVMTPNGTADTISAVGGAVGNLWGVGGITSTALAGLFAAWAAYRSRKSGRTAAVLAQIIETGSLILKTTPQGQALDVRWKTWMEKNQTQAGVIDEVLRIISSSVDPASAQVAADKLVATMEAKKV